MQKICKYCKHREYGKIDGSSEKIHYCGKSPTTRSHYGKFTEGAKCIYDTERLSILFEPIDDAEIIDKLEEKEERLSTLRRKVSRLQDENSQLRNLI
jgi:hypothetical protein